jgi:hypothetical protein
MLYKLLDDGGKLYWGQVTWIDDGDLDLVHVAKQAGRRERPADKWLDRNVKDLLYAMTVCESYSAQMAWLDLPLA